MDETGHRSAYVPEVAASARGYVLEVASVRAPLAGASKIPSISSINELSDPRKGEAPPSQSAKTKMGRKVELVHQGISLLHNSNRHVQDDDDFNPMDEDLANVAGKQFVALDDCDNPHRDLGYGPTRRKTRRPARSKSGKRKMEYELLLVDSSSSEGKEDNDDKFQPEGMPASFCRDHLPNHDDTIVLEDKEGKTYETNYIAYKTGLSGGWKGFVKQQHLKVGDALVFQLVRQKTFKVYILRENEFTATDGALGLLSLDTSMVNSTPKKEKESSNEHAKSKEAVNCGIPFPCSDIDDFAAVKSIVDFKIVISNGLLVLPDHMRTTYYHLCQARKDLLHRNLPKTISPEFTTHMIVETANIAEGIRASSPASLGDLAGWKQTLESFEAMGMDVALMCKRVDDLLALLGAPSEISVVPEGYEAVRLEQARAAKELRGIESRVSTLKDSVKAMDVKMQEIVEASTRKKEQAMRNLATAPW
ncbi:hypothetical protein ACQ4PT_014587 [Festuca glaucescens]